MPRLTIARRLLPALLVFAALAFPAACISKAKDAPAAEETPVAAPLPADDVAGGFVRIRTESNGVRDAYEYLRGVMADKYPDLRLVAVAEAFSQVVAGIKFKLVCEYTEPADRAQKKLLTALVFIDLHSNRSLLDLKLNDPPVASR